MGFGDRACGRGVRPSRPEPRESGGWLWRGERQIPASYTTTSFLCLRSHGFRGKQGRGVKCTAYAAYFMGVCPKPEAASLSCGVGGCSPTTLEEEMGLPWFGGKQALPGKQRHKESKTRLSLPIFFAHTLSKHTLTGTTYTLGHTILKLRPFRSSPRVWTASSMHVCCCSLLATTKDFNRGIHVITLRHVHKHQTERQENLHSFAPVVHAGFACLLGERPPLAWPPRPPSNTSHMCSPTPPRIQQSKHTYSSTYTHTQNTG